MKEGREDIPRRGRRVSKGLGKIKHVWKIEFSKVEVQGTWKKEEKKIKLEG